MFKISILAVSLVLSASLEAITSEDGQFHASYAFDGGILIKKRAKNGWYQVHKVPASEDAIRSKEWVERMGKDGVQSLILKLVYESNAIFKITVQSKFENIYRAVLKTSTVFIEKAEDSVYEKWRRQINKLKCNGEIRDFYLYFNEYEELICKMICDLPWERGTVVHETKVADKAALNQKIDMGI